MTLLNKKVALQFADLALPQDSRAKILRRFADLADNSGFILGNVVEEFEQAFANYCEVDECVGVATGCDALLWISEGLGIGKGDEVITVANTFIGSVLPILRVGATPVLVDCHPENLQIVFAIQLHFANVLNLLFDNVACVYTTCWLFLLFVDSAFDKFVRISPSLTRRTNCMKCRVRHLKT